MTCSRYECDNINQHLKKKKNINKAAVHSPVAQKIVFHERALVLQHVTGTLLLSQRGLITLEATESKQVIIHQKNHSVALLFPSGSPKIFSRVQITYVPIH